jgi:hypothetical protein
MGVRAKARTYPTALTVYRDLRSYWGELLFGAFGFDGLGDPPTPEPLLDPLVEPKPEPELEPKPEPELEPKPDPELEPNPDPELEPNPDPELEPNPDPELEPNPEPELDPKPVPELEPKPEVDVLFEPLETFVGAPAMASRAFWLGSKTNSHLL